ncbi:MAG: 4'-phosphopantetheinyl transferase superfamily protein [Acidobacteriaceae bacterium]|nr:4'-phosphopantetheinyl transferase superfamily protein [Acidobacteriaceae bacterium]
MNANQTRKKDNDLHGDKLGRERPGFMLQRMAIVAARVGICNATLRAETEGADGMSFLPAVPVLPGMLEDDVILLALLPIADATEEELQRATALLPAEEQQRAVRFVRQEPRAEFVWTRLLFRTIAGKLLGCRPQEIAVRIAAGGKPECEGLSFSLSHTRGLVGCAISRNVAVGVDLEREDMTLEVLDIARTAFSEANVRELEASPDDESRMRSFLLLWCEREAVAKCVGRGIAEPAALLGLWKTVDFRTQPLSLPTGFQGSLAYQNDFAMRVRQPGLQGLYSVSALLESA